MIKFSIVIPIFGCEKYLQNCVESIIRQTSNQSIEVILVDDGSLDHSGEIADELGQMYSQVRVFHKENGGAASARNKGIQEAIGEYILFIDGDDTIDNDLLEKVDVLLEKDSQALIIFGMAFDYYRNDQLERRECLSCKHQGGYSIEQLLSGFDNFFSDNSLSSACNKVFRLETIRKNDMRFSENMNLYEDFDFVIRYLAYTSNVYFYSEPAYHYRLNKEDNHLHRVFDISNLKRNMLSLEKSVNLWQSKNSSFRKITEVYVNLNIQLLSLHFYLHQYSSKEIQNVIEYYFEDNCFSDFFSDISLAGKNERYLKACIAKRQYMKICIKYKMQHMVSAIKMIAKSIIR